MKRIIGNKLYDTNKAKNIANNHFRDGNNRLSHGRGTTLYRTKSKIFFAHHETCWQGEDDVIQPLTIQEANNLFETLGGHPNNWPPEFGKLKGA